MKELLKVASRQNYHKVVLCTDNQKIAQEVKRLNIEVFLTRQDCNSGSERISSVLSKIMPQMNLSNALIINVQEINLFWIVIFWI